MKVKSICNMKVGILISCCILVSYCTSNCQERKDDIVLVNTGRTERAQMANAISKLCTFDPQVLAINMAFDESEDQSVDSQLYSSLLGCSSLIMTCLLVDEGERGFYITNESSIRLIPLMLYLRGLGYINMSVRYDGDKVIKQLSTYHTDRNGHIAYHFATEVAMAFDSLATITFVNENPKTIDIVANRTFKTISMSQVLSGKVSRDEIQGKILILGFLGVEGGKNAGKSSKGRKRGNNRDEYLTEILANAVAQILGLK
jgi:CHASE2 domain-containing sensor protein